MSRSHAASRSAPWHARRRVALGMLAGVYLLGVWLDGSGSGIPASLLPRTGNYFVQVAALFPFAAVTSIDYRAEGFVCSERVWRELDTRPYFPIDPDDKENRFSRAMHFFRENRITMTALDSYLVENHNSARHEDGIPRDRAIGGVRLSSLRIPIPSPGGRMERFSRRPLSFYPEEQRKVLYHTPGSKLVERCGGHIESGD